MCVFTISAATSAEGFALFDFSEKSVFTIYGIES